MSKLKVLMLGWEFPPIINGGLGIACLGMAKAMAKQVDLSVILPKSDPDFVLDNVNVIGLNNATREEVEHIYSTSYYKDFVDVCYIDSEILPYDEVQETVRVEREEIVKEKTEVETKIHKHKIFEIGELYDENIAEKVQEYAKVAATIAKEKDFDVIHAHDWMTFLAGVEIKKQTGKPLAVHVHSLSYDRNGPDSRGWIYDIEQYGMQEADMVIPVSRYTGNICQFHYGIHPGKIFPVHNGVEPVESFREEKNFPEQLVLFLGRVTLQKGPEVFLEIAEKVLEKNKDVRFVMAGTGDKLKGIIEEGAYKAIGDKFHFTGFLNKTKVNKLLSIADVYCMPSVSEPFGLSALEAAQFGIPTVVSKQSGVAEVLSGALIADFWDSEKMAKNILTLLNNKSAKAKSVKKSNSALKNLTWDSSAEKTISIFENFVNA